MKILVELLEYKQIMTSGEKDWIIQKSKTVEITSKNIIEAKEKFDQLKQTLPENQKLRIIEYHNDESDETRKPCKVLFE